MSRRRRRTRLRFGRRRKRRGAIGWSVTIGAWGAALALLVWGVAAWWPSWYVTDHMAGLVAQGLIAALVVLVGCGLTKRWGACAVAAVGSALMLGVLLWSHREPDPSADDGVGRFPLQALVVNFNTLNPEAMSGFDQVSKVDADVMAWVETPNALMQRLRWDTAFRERYPFVHIPAAARGGFPILLSRWPLLTRRSGWERRLELIGEGGFLLAVVDHPEGQFVLVWMSPLSPRYPERWAEGNAVVRRFGESLNEWFGSEEQRSLPVIVLGDQNATPTNWRSRWLRAKTGLRRAKPLSVLEGTFPSGLRWPLSVAIDDAFVSGDIVVEDWRVLEARGSDHLPVVMDLLVPAGGAVDQAAVD